MKDLKERRLSKIEIGLLNKVVNSLEHILRKEIQRQETSDLAFSFKENGFNELPKRSILDLLKVLKPSKRYTMRVVGITKTRIAFDVDGLALSDGDGIWSLEPTSIINIPIPKGKYMPSSYSVDDTLTNIGLNIYDKDKYQLARFEVEDK